MQAGIQRGHQIGVQKGLQKGLQKGIKEGILKGKLETAEAMLKEKMPADKIAQITGLPLKEIKKLAESIQQKDE